MIKLFMYDLYRNVTTFSKSFVNKKTTKICETTYIPFTKKVHELRLEYQLTDVTLNHVLHAHNFSED